MSRLEREQVVATLAKRFSESNGAIVMDYKGLNVEKITGLRQQVREAGSEIKVAKNTLLKDLIIRGADLNYEDHLGYSAITKAAKKGHLTTLKILINAGANVNVAPEGRSVLMRVVEDNNMLLSQLLIAGGADVNFRDANGDTALKIARRLGYFDLDLMLVQSGARP